MKTFVSEKNKQWIETNQSVLDEMGGLNIDGLEVDTATKNVLKKMVQSILNLQKLHENN